MQPYQVACSEPQLTHDTHYPCWLSRQACLLQGLGTWVLPQDFTNWQDPSGPLHGQRALWFQGQGQLFKHRIGSLHAHPERGPILTNQPSCNQTPLITKVSSKNYFQIGKVHPSWEVRVLNKHERIHLSMSCCILFSLAGISDKW